MFHSPFPLFLVPLLASISSAAIVYEPVQYQYGSQPTIYYGGANSHVFRYADRLHCLRQASGIGANRFGYGYVYPGLITEPAYVFSDCVPYENASFYGFTPADAHNEAYAASARYFRKGDALAAGVVEADGTVVVPPQVTGDEPRITIRPFVGPSRASTHPILVIPKKALEPAPASSGVVVAGR